MPSKPSKLMLLALVVMGLLCSSCNTAERIEFVHEPTKDLQKSYAIDDPKLAAFMHDGILLYPRVVFRTTGTLLVLAAASKTQRTITVRRAQLSGIGELASKTQDYPVDQTVRLGKEVKPGVYRSSVTVHKIDQAELEALGAGGGLRFTVVLRIGEAKEDLTVDYEIKRRVTKPIVSH